MTKVTTFILFILFPFFIFAQSGIKGTIKDHENKPLPYATIYIQELHTGTVTNEDGFYQYKLPKGSYHINYQYLGYKSEIKTASITNEMLTLNVKLANQSINLKEVNIVASAEDPAYSIMRKTVAKSKYHLMQVTSYKALVYIKGFFKLDVPKIVYKMAKSEGIDSVEVNTSESLNELEYEYPNTYRQKVLSARSNEEDSSRMGVNNYINSSFYASPLLSSSAFGLYRFKLEGSFNDQGYEIYKIKVFPRSKGPDLFTGYLYIIKDLWAIHSLNLEAYNMGFKTLVSQIYAPVKENAWLPISHTFDINGRMLGVKINYKYFATVSDYKVEINEKLDKKKLIVIDEKTELEYAAALKDEKQRRGLPLMADTSKTEDTAVRFSLKDLKKAMKEMEKREKESRKKKDEPEVMSDYSISFDSLAYKQKTSYWDSIRPVPLTDLEKKPGFGKKNDSIREARKADTASRFAFLGNTFGGLIFGKTIRISKGFDIHYPSPLAHANFNTVEGYNLNLPLEFIFKKKGKELITITQTVRYGFSSKDLYYNTHIRYRLKTNKYGQRANIQAEGGHYISQYNDDEPIFPIINSFATLLWNNNFMKIYQKDYASIQISYPLRSNIHLKAGFEWANRKELTNSTSEIWINNKTKNYTSNAPANNESQNNSIAIRKASTFNLQLTYKPFVKYYKNNGQIRVNDNQSPKIKLNYTTGIKDFLESQADYQRLEASLIHHFNGVRRDFEFNLFAGSTFNNKASSIIDYKHFGGNQTFIQISEPATAYYMLDYYRYSTAKNYWGAQTQLSFRKFLLTQNMWLNLLGVRENIIFNYLKTETSAHYVELGYGLDNIFKFMKIQAITSFENGKYQGFAIRIGLSGVFRFEED
jgi:hypothetical protein